MRVILVGTCQKSSSSPGDQKPFNIIDWDTLFEPRETSVSVDQSYGSDCSEEQS